MDDKLLELRNMSGRKEVSLNTSLSSDGDDFMPEFNAKTKKAQQLLERIKDNNERVVELQEKYSHATTSQQEKEISRELDQIIAQNNQLTLQLKDIMTSISGDVDQSKEKEPNEPETRMKQNMQGALQTKVSDVLKTSQQVQMEFRQGLKQKISRQTKFLDSSLSDEQIEDICNDPQRAQELLQQKLYGQASTQLQNAVSDIQDKFRDIQKLEQSVNQVYQLFVDMAMLVHQQGEMLDNIELSINSAQNYVNKGEKKLIEAKEDHQSARKKQCCLMLIGIAILGAIVGGVVAAT